MLRFLVLSYLFLLPLLVTAQSLLPQCPFFSLVKHDCYGERTYPGGVKYIGEFRDNRRNGKGREIFPSGHQYVGEFRDGKRNGQGTYIFPSGEKYVGEFRDDKRNGQGVEYGADGAVSRAGHWSEGAFVITKLGPVEAIPQADQAKVVSDKPRQEASGDLKEGINQQRSPLLTLQQLQAHLLDRHTALGITQSIKAHSVATPHGWSKPSYSYGRKVVQLIRDNIVYNEPKSSQLTVVVLVQASRDGKIAASKVVGPSGKPAFDESVLRGIQKMGAVPKDVDGRIPEIVLREGLQISVSTNHAIPILNQVANVDLAFERIFNDLMGEAINTLATTELTWKDKLARAVQVELGAWLSPDATGLSEVPTPAFPAPISLKQEAWESNAEFEARVQQARFQRSEAIDLLESSYRLLVEERNRRVEQYNQIRRERALTLSEYRRGLVLAGTTILAPTPLILEARFDQQNGALTILSQIDGLGKQVFSFAGTPQAFRRAALSQPEEMTVNAEFQVSDSGEVVVAALNVEAGGVSARGLPSTTTAAPMQLASVTIASTPAPAIAQQSAVTVDRNQVEQILYREENESLRKRLEDQRRQQEQALANAEARAAAEIARIRAEADAERKKLAESRPVQNIVSVQEAHALVIGNSAYRAASRLANPVNDATAMSAKLRSMGFRVTEISNASREQMVRGLSEFSKTAARADLTLLFYAGHGVQIQGINYMVPVDMSLSDPSQATLQAVSLTQVVEQYLPGKTKLVFLDACRDNPLMNSGLRGVARGLAPISVSEGTLISYATKDGQTAEDGVGSRNSPFTTALLEHLGDPNDIAVVLRKVREKVMQATGGKQQPWEYGSLTGGELVLSAIRRAEK